MTEIVHDLEYIQSLLDESAEYGLTSEVVFFALQSMKNNPNLTIAQAIQMGYDEWVK